MEKFTFVLRENTLTDNVLIIPQKGYIFKYGIIAQIKEYTYASAWSDKEKITNFKSKKQLVKYLDKFYSDVDYLDFTGTCLE
jgi:hypothetical protein